MSGEFDKYRAEALEILSRVPLIDGHNDWAMYIRRDYGNRLDSRFDEGQALSGHQDIQRLRTGKIGGAFWSAYVGCPGIKNDFSEEVYYKTIHDTMQQIDVIHRLIDRYKGHLELIQRADDFMTALQRGKIGGMIGIEGLHQIGNSPAILRDYHRLGARYVTLTHNCNNMYADAHNLSPVHGGLSAEGKKMVLEMNRVGLMIDLAHVSEAVMLDALSVSKAPVAFTHSNCYALNPHTRNATNAALDKLKANNGVIMVTFVANFVHKDPNEATIEHVVDHIMHVAERIGFNHIGIGSDFDGTKHVAKGLEDVTKFPDLVACMLQRGIEAANIEKILGLNVIRVMKGVEETAEKLKSEAVLEEDIKPEA